jgi:hypothetical protein
MVMKMLGFPLEFCFFLSFLLFPSPLSNKGYGRGNRGKRRKER